MLINFHQAIRKHRLRIKGIIHVGAHFGEEYDDYKRAGISNITFIEPCKPAFEKLTERFQNTPGVYLFNCACGTTKTRAIMNVEHRNGGQSNSILKPEMHLQHYPDIQFIDQEEVDVIPLDDLPQYHDFNLLMMDVQGYELEVLKGAFETLKHVDYVYTEVNSQEIYSKCAKVEEIDRHLTGFRRVETKWTRQGWGDALYKRK